MRVHPIVVLQALVILCPVHVLTAGPNWPCFRGPGALGVSQEKDLPSKWSSSENVRWSQDVPGRGWSSPVVWGDRVFLTTVLSDGPVADAKKGLYFGGNRKKPPLDQHHWVIYCLDSSSGKVRWKKTVAETRPRMPLHIKNTYASETPVTDGERIYAYFGNIGVFAHDLDGKPVWSRTFDAVKTRYDWGTAASPVLHGERLYIINDNEQKSYLVALDRKTGKPIWRVERDEKSNWSTPCVWENPVRTEIVTTGSGRVRSYDLSGQLVWELRGMSSITIPTPFSTHGLLYIASGYVLDPLRPVYAIRPGASGDISLDDDKTSSTAIAWCDRAASPYNTSTLVHGDYFYTLFDRGFLGCRDAKTGKVVYKKRRLEDAGGFTSSPWAHDGKIFCLDEDGNTFVIKAGPEFGVEGVNSLDEMCMATPAIASGRLYIRTLTKLYCLENGARPAGKS